MVCIYCSGKTSVTNSRKQKRPNQIWRRRQCQECGAVFTTEERPLTDTSVMILRRGRSEPFSREILLLSLYDSLRHRKTAITDAKALTDTVWSRLLPQIDSATLQRDDLVATTTEVLRRFDKAAATSYHAFHP